MREIGIQTGLLNSSPPLSCDFRKGCPLVRHSKSVVKSEFNDKNTWTKATNISQNSRDNSKRHQVDSICTYRDAPFPVPVANEGLVRDLTGNAMSSWWCLESWEGEHPKVYTVKSCGGVFLQKNDSCHCQEKVASKIVGPRLWIKAMSTDYCHKSNTKWTWIFKVGWFSSTSPLLVDGS